MGWTGGLLSEGRNSGDGCWQPDRIFAFKAARGAKVGRHGSGNAIRNEDE